MSRWFVCWDFGLSGALLDNLEGLRERPPEGIDQLHFLPPDHLQSGCIGDDVAGALREAERVLAVLDTHNANVCWELGLALGSGRRVDLGTAAARERLAEDWVDAEPFGGLGQVHQLEELETWTRLPSLQGIQVEPAQGGSETLVLCPKTVLHAVIPSHWRVERSPSFDITSPAQALDGVGRVVWIISMPPSGSARDGRDNAVNAIIAGFAEGSGLDVQVLHDEHYERKIQDVARRAVSFRGRDALRQRLSELPAHANDPTPDPLQRYRAALRAQHDRLGLFNWGDAVHAIVPVRVQVQVDQLCGFDRIGAGVTGLQELASLRRADGPRTRWTLSGDPGAGKTTLARHLTWTLAGEDQDLPLLLSLATWSRRGTPDVFDWTEGRLSRSTGLADRLRELAGQGRLWLLLDGLDEVAPDRIEDVLQVAQELGRDYPETPLVLLGRPVALGNRLLPGWGRAHVSALDLGRQQELVERLAPEQATELLEWIRGNAGLRALAGSPLLLTLMVLVARHAAKEKRPKTPTQVYDQAIAHILERGYRPDVQGIEASGKVKSLLVPMSLTLHQVGGESWTEQQVWEALDQARDDDETLSRRLSRTWPRDKDLVEALKKDCGVLGPHDGPFGEWRYLHRSFRERLAAEACGVETLLERVRSWAQDRPQGYAEARAWDRAQGVERWAEVVAHAAAIAADPRQLMAGLRQAHRSLALRVLPWLEQLSPVEQLLELDQIQGWDGEDLWPIVARWGDARLAAGTVALLDRLDPQEADLSRAAAVGWVLDRRGRWPGDLFERLERPGMGPLPDTAAIPAGDFWMGDELNGPRHRVTLTLPARAGRTPVTAAELRQLLPGWPGEDRRPAVEVSWWTAWLYARWVGGRLPTEAEWEHACRAGTETVYWSGNEEDDLAQVGWYGRNSGGKLRDVGRRPANPWGLHDLHGLVWEWCADDLRPYTEAPADDPVGPQGPVRVVRGGSFLGGANGCRSAYRLRGRPSVRGAGQGFRVFLPSA